MLFGSVGMVYIIQLQLHIRVDGGYGVFHHFTEREATREQRDDDAVFYYICSEYIEFMGVQNVGNVYLQST